jgi:hypothetical protein
MIPRLDRAAGLRGHARGSAWVLALAATVLASERAEAAGGVNPSLSTLAPNTWRRMETGGLAPPNDGTRQGNIATGILSYSGGTLDRVNHRILVFGGGHCDYSGNEVWAYDTERNTWQQMYLPTPAPSGTCNAFPFDPTYPGAIVSGGVPTRPQARHTYDQIEFMDAIGEAMVFSGPVWGNNITDEAQKVPRDTWTYSFANNRWTWRNVTRGAQPSGYSAQGLASAYASSNGRVYAVFQGETWSYDPSTDRWTDLGHPSPGGIDKNMVYDSARNRLWLYGGDYPSSNALWRYDIGISTSWTQVSVPAPLPNPGGMAGLAYDPGQDVLVLMGGEVDGSGPAGNGIWMYNIATNRWTDMRPAVDGGGSPPQSGHTYGRFMYDPANNVFFLVTASGGSISTWAYRYAGGAPPADTTPPSRTEDLRPQ